jgi:Cu/Ag efflux protein CusF
VLYRLAATLSLSLPVLLLLCACDADKEPVQSYHVRGLIQDVNGSGADARVTIHHEAVAKFKDRDGHASDMASMKMIFGFGPTLSAADVKVGDKIAFDFDVRWSESPTLVVTKLQKLAPDVALALAGEP